MKPLYIGTVLDGEPIIKLPPKYIELKKVDFSQEERDFYSRLEADSRAQFEVRFLVENYLIYFVSPSMSISILCFLQFEEKSHSFGSFKMFVHYF